MTDDTGTDAEPEGRVPSRRPTEQRHRVPPPQPPPGERGRTISVEISPRHIRLIPGQTDTATVTIRYHGAVVDELTLSVSGETAAWARVAPDVLNVYPDTQAQSTIRFAPPRGPQPAAGLLELQLEVASRSDPAATVVQGASIEIEPFDDLGAATQGTTSLSGKREGVLPIKVRNLGNRPAAVSVQASDAGGAVTSLSAVNVALDPGAESTIWATVRPKTSMAFGNAKVHPFTIVVSSDRSPPVTIDGRFEQLPSFGRLRLGVVGAAAAALVGLAVVAVLAFGGGPGPTASPKPTPTDAAVLTTPPATTAPPTVAETTPPATSETPSAPTETTPATETTEVPTTAAPTTPAPPTPVPTISAAFLSRDPWTLRSVEFPPISFSGVDPAEISQAGDGLTFSNGVTSLIGQWSLRGANRSITCRATYGPGDTLTTFDVDYDGPPFGDLFAGAIQEALCGTNGPWTVGTATVLARFTTDLTMTNPNGTTLVWRRSDLIVTPTFILPRP